MSKKQFCFWSSGLVFGGVPEGRQLFERQRGERFSAGIGRLLYLAEARNEFFAGLFKRGLGIDAAEAADLDGGKEHIAKLFFEIGAAFDGGAQLLRLLVELIERAGDIGEFKARLCGLALKLVRPPARGANARRNPWRLPWCAGPFPAA